jgi:hypothetical protein
VSDEVSAKSEPSAVSSPDFEKALPDASPCMHTCNTWPDVVNLRAFSVALCCHQWSKDSPPILEL